MLKVIDQTPEIKLSLKTFLIGITFGAVYSYLVIADFDQFLELIKPIYEDILNVQQDFLSIALAILQRNLTAVLIILCLGILYKYLPLIPLFFNGFIVGIFFYATIVFLHQTEKLLLILPHGIFEIPALIFSVGIAIRLSKIAKPQNLWGRIKALIYSKNQIAIIILLLITAATIETSLIIWF